MDSHREPPSRRTREGVAMKTTRRAKLTAAVTAASVLAVCATAAISSAASAASSGTTTISVASLIPGSTKAATTQFNNQVKQFEKGQSWHQGEVGPSTSGRGRHSPPSSRLAPCRRSSPCRSPTDARLGTTASLRRPHQVREGAAVLQAVQPRRDRRGHVLEGQDHRGPDRRLRAGAALQPRALLAGRARPEQASDDLGAGCVGREDHHAEDRQGRLRPDGQGRQHRRAGS